jgi:hypothetical protein
VSESESIASRSTQASVTRSDADDLPPDLATRAVPEREGLPRNYRMRADAHYVDQLEAPATPVIRMVKTGQIDCRDLPSSDQFETLTKSIGVHGVLQPLLVRRQGARYSLIAGRKRLAAAIAGGLSVVPCALHDVEGAAAAALTAAENVRGDDSAIDEEVDRRTPYPVLETITADLTTVRASVALLRTGRPGGLSNKVGAELIASHAARAEWLLTCLLGTFEHANQAPLAAIIQRVADEFSAHSALGPLELQCSVSPAAAVWKLPEESATAAISGAVFAMLSCLEGVSRQRIELHADAQHPRAVRVEVVQRAARVAPTLGSDSLSGLNRPAELIPALALRLARSVATPLGGSAELTPLPGIGSVLQITFGQTS